MLCIVSSACLFVCLSVCLTVCVFLCLYDASLAEGKVDEDYLLSANIFSLSTYPPVESFIVCATEQNHVGGDVDGDV